MFTVTWTAGAKRQLAEICVVRFAIDLQAVADAADQIDLELARDPHGVGESREEFVRVHLVAPLGVRYAVFDDHNGVLVMNAWHYSTPT